MKESAVTKPKAAAKKPVSKPAAPERDAAEAAAYEQGRRARKVAIARDQAPFGKDDPLLKHWHKGWDFEDDQRG